MLGILSNFLPFKEQSWKDVLQKRVPLKFLLLNLDGFHNGKEIGRKYLNSDKKFIQKSEG
jgi:hypothetical protein